MLWSGEAQEGGTFWRKKITVPALAVSWSGWYTGFGCSESPTAVMTTGMAPFGAVVAIFEVDARVGSGVASGVGTGVASDGLGDRAFGDAAAVDSVAVGELDEVDVAAGPQPPRASASTTTKRVRRELMVEAFPSERP
jgi:hypothetical protein